MNNTPETDAELYPMNGVDIVWPDFARKLERERDEAREETVQLLESSNRLISLLREKRVLKETNLRQTERIRYLEGATNHASGTPLSVALRDRDEAREYSKATWRSLRDSQDEVLRLTFENRELRNLEQRQSSMKSTQNE